MSSGRNRQKRIFAFEWDAVAGIVAAVIAIVLHLLHVVEEGVLLSIALVLLALMFVRDLRSEHASEVVAGEVHDAAARTRQIEALLQPVDARLVGPQELRQASARFAARAAGDMVWFHVCLSMFRTQALFDAMLRPAIENPAVKSILFVLDEGERELWDREVLPKVQQCIGSSRVHEPCWARIDESISVIFSGGEDGHPGDALLSFWGEPFMSHATDRPVPRYIFWIRAQSELIGRLSDVERKYRLRS